MAHIVEFLESSKRKQAMNLHLKVMINLHSKEQVQTKCDLTGYIVITEIIKNTEIKKNTIEYMEKKYRKKHIF